MALLCACMMLSLIAANTTILSLPLALGARYASVLLAQRAHLGLLAQHLPWSARSFQYCRDGASAHQVGHVPHRTYHAAHADVQAQFFKPYGLLAGLLRRLAAAGLTCVRRRATHGLSEALHCGHRAHSIFLSVFGSETDLAQCLSLGSATAELRGVRRGVPAASVPYPACGRRVCALRRRMLGACASLSTCVSLHMIMLALT